MQQIVYYRTAKCSRLFATELGIRLGWVLKELRERGDDLQLVYLFQCLEDSVASERIC